MCNFHLKYHHKDYLITGRSEVAQGTEASFKFEVIDKLTLMKDNIKIDRLTKFDSFRLNRDQVMDQETRFKILTIVSNFVTASPKTIQTLIFFYDFCDILKNWQTY